MNNTKEKSEGITLIALVITIIILLVLAGITIAQLTGNGLFNKTIQTKEKYQDSEKAEQNTLNEYGEYIDNGENYKDDLDEKNKDKDIYKNNMVFLEHFDDIKYKFGNAAVYINDTYISYPAKEEYKLDKDFTIDYWVYESSNNIGGAFNAHIVSSVAGGIWAGLYNGQYTIQITGVGDLMYIDKPQNNEWTHIAICRKDNNLSVYFNGELKETVQTDYVFQPGVLTIGNDIYNGGLYSKNIYIDEVRILNGVAQWTENFTPFTQAYSIY